jgi:hypothetical protein
MLFCAALVVPPAASQVQSGTVLILGYSKAKVFMVADSRVTHLSGKVDNTQCKIAALGDKLLFGVVNIEGFEANIVLLHSWTAVGEARKVFEIEKVRKSGSIDTLSAYWASAVQGDLVELIKYDSEAVIHSIEREGPVLMYGVFAGQDADGTLAARVVTMACENTRKEFPCTVDLIRQHRAVLTVQQYRLVPDSRLQLQPFGVTATFLKFDNPWSKLSVDDRRKWESILPRGNIKDADVRRAMKFVDLTIAYDPNRNLVGGDVHAAEIRRGGPVRWLPSKPDCPQN